MTEEAPDFPFDDVAKTAREWIEKGGTVYQKFTCDGCGKRLTIDEPNKFYTKGRCDSCPAITDIRAKGCNYLLIYSRK